MKKSIVFLLLTVFSLTTLAQGNYQDKLGYGISPKGHPYDFSQFGTFLQEVANTCNGGIVYANGNWRDSFNSSGQIPASQKTISLLQPSPFGYVDMLNFGWSTPPLLYLNVPGDTNNNWTNTTAKNLFLQMLINAADSLQPTYFFIGNEVSIYWEQDSSDYLNWISFYHQAYDSIKAHSPSSKVGTTFNYEHLSGNGIFVGFNTPYWNAFNVLDTSKIDILGLTVYPFFNYAHADSVPLNYLDGIFSRMGNKPVAITETGWPGDSLIGPWYASSAEQVDYVNKIFSVISGKNVEVVNWLFLNYAMDTTNTDEMLLFKSVALRDSLGIDRPALPLWLSQCNTISIEEKNEDSETIKIYPNPFSSQTTLQTDNLFKDATLTVYNSFGQTVKQIKNISGRTITLHRDNLSSGLYFIRLTQDNKTFITDKLVITD